MLRASCLIVECEDDGGERVGLPTGHRLPKRAKGGTGVTLAPLYETTGPPQENE